MAIMLEQQLVKFFDEVDARIGEGAEIEIKVYEVEQFLNDMDLVIEGLENNGYEVIQHNVPKDSWGCMDHTVLTIIYEN